MSETIKYPLYALHRFFVAALAVGLAVLLSTVVAYAAGVFETVDPLPDGCVRPTPPGEDAPICCLSGFVYLEGAAIENALVTVSDAQGKIGEVYTKRYRGAEPNPYYYFDLTKLDRIITPTDQITIVASYSGIVDQLANYTVQPGGQRVNFNLYDDGTMPLQNQNVGISEIGKFNQVFATSLDAVGNLYLWDGNAHMQILRSTGEWFDQYRWPQTTGIQPNRLLYVQNIAIDRKNDRVYLAHGIDGQNQTIKLYSKDGLFIKDVIPGNGTVVAMGTDNAGNLYIAKNEGLFKYDTDWHLTKQITRTMLPEEQRGQRISVAPNGDVYVNNGTAKGIFKYNSDLQPISAFTLTLSAGEPFTTQADLAIDTNNQLFVHDSATKRLFVFDANGQQLRPSQGVSAPYQYVEVSDNFLYLIGYDGNFVQFSKQDSGTDLTPIKHWGGVDRAATSIAEPGDITLAPDGSLFVADKRTGRIYRMMDNEIKQSWVLSDVAKTPGNVPVSLAFDGNNRLLIAHDGHVIQRFNYDFAQSILTTDTVPFGGNGSELGKFASPTAIDVDNNGNIFVVDPGNKRVQVLREIEGSIGFSPVTSATAAGILTDAFGIAVDKTSNPIMVYVSGRNYIARFRFENDTLIYNDTFGGPTRFIYGPKHLVIDKNHFLWVAGDNQVYRIDLSQSDLNDTTKWQISNNKQDAADANWSAYGIAVSQTVDNQNLLYVASRVYGLVSSFKTMVESAPIATIVRCSNGDLLPGEPLTCVAAGQDGDASNSISRYEWSSDSGFLVTTDQPNITIATRAGNTTPSQLGSGLHILRLRVRGNEGNDTDPNLDWSQPVSTTVFVVAQIPDPRPTNIPTPDPITPPPTPPATCPVGSRWTLLLYLDADNKNDGKELLAEYRKSIKKLEQLHHACVQAAVQIDGPASIDNPTQSDSERWLIRFDSDSTTPTSIAFTIPEQEMDSLQDLEEFIKWGQSELPADHYYLAIADHGNAIQGIAFDHTSNAAGNAYLSANDLYAALHAPGVLPIDILHLDACSMALLDVAYNLRDKVQIMIASQYIGWSFFAYADYASYIGQWTEPEALAKLIVDRYATLAEAKQLPYTLSALKLKRIEVVKSAINDLAAALINWAKFDSADEDRHQKLFDLIRNDISVSNGIKTYNALFFDSNSNYINSPRDAYIDLKDFVTRIERLDETNTIPLPIELTRAVTRVIAELDAPIPLTDKVILHERHSSIAYLPDNLPREAARNARIDMTHASGISLYYPVEGNDLLALPKENGVEETAAASIGASSELTYTQVYSDYIADQLFDLSSFTRWGELLELAYGLPPAASTLISATAPLLPPSPVNNSYVILEQSYQLQDLDNNGASSGDQVLFETVIQNQSTVRLTNVVLLQTFNQAVEPTVNAAQYPCSDNNAQQVCISLPEIAAGQSITIPFSVTLTTNLPLVSQATLYVNGKPLGDTVEPTAKQEQIFLPVVMK